MGLPRVVAECRRAVRRTVADLPDGAVVLVACSGGADSLALAAATVREGGNRGLRVVGVTVDHRLQPGSATQAARVVDQLLGVGCAEAKVLTVSVDPAGDGPEAAARRARYAALDRFADEYDAACILLGHTRDDQAETVLLGLARGSGARSLAGMRPAYGRYRRPFLDITRAETVAACAAEGWQPWADPHNDDPRYTRVRVRRTALPALAEALGPGVPEALARTAAQLRDDADALDALARTTYERLRLDTPTGSSLAGGLLDDLAGQGDGPGQACRVVPGDGLRQVRRVAAEGGTTGAAYRDAAAVELDVSELVAAPRAIATRVLRLAALDADAIDAELFHVHIVALHDLITGEIRGEVQLPGHVAAHIDGGSLIIARTGVRS